MVVRRSDGWHLSFPGGTYSFSTDQPSVGWSSASVDVERDGRVDWFVASSSGAPASDGVTTALDGLFRIDDVRTSCARDLATEVPFLSLRAISDVDRWEDTTGDGVPELLVTATHYDVDWDHAGLDLYLVDPTTTGRSAAIADLAIGHVAVPRGDSGTVADFDGDGHPEVVYADLDRHVLVFLGTIPPDGEPAVPVAEVATSDRLDAIGYAVAGNLNGDGSADLALTWFKRGVWLENGEYVLGTTVGRVLYGGPDLGAVALDDAPEIDVEPTLVADFDGDGLDDVATCCGRWRGSPQPFRMDVRYGDPGGLSATADRVISVPTLQGSPSVADVDGGGLPDLLLHDYYVESGGTGPYGTTLTRESQGGVLYRGEDGFASPALVLDVEVDGPWYEPHDEAKWGPLVDIDLDGYPDILARDLQWEDEDPGLGDELSMNVLWGGPVP